MQLIPGKYQFECECGGEHEIIYLTRTHKKMMPICAYCRRKGLFKLITMDDLIFNYNWNGKLNNNSFTTIRLHNPEKYAPGKKLNIILDGRQKGIAVILEVKTIRLNMLNEFTARIDTGYPLEECKNMIRTMYKNKPLVNWDTQLLSFILLAYEKVQTTNLFSNIRNDGSNDNNN